MTPLDWKDATESEPLENSSGRSTDANPWFPVAMGLIGLIAGFLLGNLLY